MKDIIKPNMQAVLFCRVSTKEQEETGFSLPSQQKLLKEYSTRKGFITAKVFLVSESASGKKQRKTFIEMMQFIKKEKLKIIICEKTDRLTRNLKDTQIMYDWLEEDEERQIHLVKDSLILHKNSRSQEKLNLDIRVVFAKNYIDNLSEEVKKGQKEKIAQGWLPTKPPLGYKTIGEEGRKIHILNNSIAPLVREMFEIYATGEQSIERLTKLMYEKGLRYPNGADVCKGRIHQLLFNPFYYGKISWNNDLYEGKQEALISQELFEQVQQILRRKNTPKYSKHFYTLRKLTTCKECNSIITWETQKGHVYGHCNRYKGCSQKVYVKESDIENELSKAFLKLQINNPRINAWLLKVLELGKTEVVQKTTNTLQDLQAKLELVDKKMEDLYDDKEDGVITKDFYLKKSKKYNDEKKAVEKLFTNTDDNKLKSREVGINVYKLSQKAYILFKKAKPEYKRELIKLVFDDLLIENGELEYTYSEGFTILFALVNAFNSSNFTNIEELVNREFERREKIVIARQIDSFATSYPVLLSSLDSNQNKQIQSLLSYR
jgi:site-specific DNA recombinase